GRSFAGAGLRGPCWGSWWRRLGRLGTRKCSETRSRRCRMRSGCILISGFGKWRLIRISRLRGQSICGWDCRSVIDLTGFALGENRSHRAGILSPVHDGEDPDRALEWSVRDQVVADNDEAERTRCEIKPSVTSEREINEGSKLPVES